jgi:hypothetical protein
MTYLEILDLIERNYKVGDDWVYEKGKSQEIKIIKELLEKYQENRDRILELMVEHGEKHGLYDLEKNT